MIRSTLRAIVSVGILNMATIAQAQHMDRVAPDVIFDDAVLSKIEYGLVCPTGDAKRLPAPDTHLGFITQRDEAQRIEHSTQVIPLSKGIGFGVDIELPEGVDLRGVEIAVFHPRYPGTEVTQESWISDFNADASHLNFFLFEFPFEMVAGDWAMQASHNGTLLYSVSFKVVAPSRIPNLSSYCSGALLS